MDETVVDYIQRDAETGDDLAPSIGRVRAFAMKAHGNQKDKNGLPYVTHLDAVALNTVRLFGYDPVLLTVAYLHDVVEDTKYTQSDIDHNFSEDVATAVYAITKLKGEANPDYITAVAENEIASMVKLADIAHNTDPDRLALLSESTQSRLLKKYRPAIYRLCRALDIEPWVTYEEAVAAIRADAVSSKPREISVSSLLSGDKIKFAENGHVYEAVNISNAIMREGISYRDVRADDEDGTRVMRLRSSHKVTLMPRSSSAKWLDAQVAKYMGE